MPRRERSKDEPAGEPSAAVSAANVEARSIALKQYTRSFSRLRIFVLLLRVAAVAVRCCCAFLVVVGRVRGGNCFKARSLRLLRRTCRPMPADEATQ
jgi:hypothetical protein